LKSFPSKGNKMSIQGKPDTIRAKMFAEIAHAGQVYNCEVPYTFHLENVVEVLKRFQLTDPVMICAGYLHDAIEDTTKSFNDIKERFGEDVAELVYCVTSELGRNRKERNIKTYPKIAANRMAVMLKLADRIANVEYGLASGGKFEMYAKEFPDFYKALSSSTTDVIETNMWNHLKRLLRVE
jgi:guanosine-3',5'-bis(diphosphate) 3'-pyrophosphohydrolase